MTWLLIDKASKAIIAGPLDSEPVPTDAQMVEEVPGDGYLWSAAKGGFVEKAKRLLQPGEFMMLFTQAERIALRTAAASSPVVLDYIELVNGFTAGLDLTHPLLVTAIEHIRDAGLVTADRATAILAGTPPLTP